MSDSHLPPQAEANDGWNRRAQDQRLDRKQQQRLRTGTGPFMDPQHGTERQRLKQEVRLTAVLRRYADMKKGV